MTHISMTVDYRSAVDHLQNADPVLGGVMSTVGPCELKLRREYFDSLVRSIVSQQVSTAAALTIYNRLRRAVAPGRLNASRILALSSDSLAAAGLSRQKASYLMDLAQRVDSSSLRLARLRHLEDEQVIAELTQVRGIGRWTAQMFLIFVLGRPDVLPTDDLGIRDSVRQVYRLRSLPTASRLERIARPWRPYASVACWYLWQIRSGSAKAKLSAGKVRE